MANVDVTRIAGNIGALNALNSLNTINKQLAVHQGRLSSGKAINSAADDPAGLTIATKMNANSQGLKTSLANIADAKNLLSVAEAGVGGINDILVQMRNKALTGASDTMGTDERAAIVTQMTAFAQQIDDISTQTKWNGNSLIGSATFTSVSLTFQVGSNTSDIVTTSAITNLDRAGLGITAGTVTALTTAALFNTFVGTIDTAMKKVNGELTNIGSLSGRLSFKEDQVTTAQLNVEASYNRIMNANMAEEQMNASKYTILQQTSVAMLSQANSAPQSLLSLFR